MPIPGSFGTLLARSILFGMEIASFPVCEQGGGATEVRASVPRRERSDRKGGVRDYG